MAGIDPRNCQHRNLHVGRFDGARTVCFDCRMPVAVILTAAATDRDLAGQYHDGLVACEKDLARGVQ